MLAKLEGDPYVGYIDQLARDLVEDRQAFFDGVNGGSVWRNMGSIADLSDRRVTQALVQLAEALDAAHLVNDETMAVVEGLRTWLRNLPPDPPVSISS